VIIAATAVALQALLLWGAAGFGVIGIFQQRESLVAALFLLGITLGFALWSSMTALKLWQLERWAHTAAVVQQLIFISIGVASFTGEFANLLIGWLLFGPATIAFIALLTKAGRHPFRGDREDL
jgi:hypothetical protein